MKNLFDNIRLSLCELPRLREENQRLWNAWVTARAEAEGLKIERDSLKADLEQCRMLMTELYPSADPASVATDALTDGELAEAVQFSGMTNNSTDPYLLGIHAWGWYFIAMAVVVCFALVMAGAITFGK